MKIFLATLLLTTACFGADTPQGDNKGIPECLRVDINKKTVLLQGRQVEYPPIEVVKAASPLNVPSPDLYLDEFKRGATDSFVDIPRVSSEPVLVDLEGIRRNDPLDTKTMWPEGTSVHPSPRSKKPNAPDMTSLFDFKGSESYEEQSDKYFRSSLWREGMTHAVRYPCTPKVKMADALKPILWGEPATPLQLPPANDYPARASTASLSMEMVTPEYEVRENAPSFGSIPRSPSIRLDSYVQHYRLQLNSGASPLTTPTKEDLENAYTPTKKSPTKRERLQEARAALGSPLDTRKSLVHYATNTEDN